MARKLTEKEYAQKIINLGYTYISGYERSTSKCKLICPKGHLRESTAYNLKSSPKCPTCVKLENRDKSLKEFLKYIKENTEEYTYISGYKTTQDKCLMRHEKCGTEWEVKPNNFTCSHSRCPTCVDKRNTLYITEEKWKKYVEDCLPEHTYLTGFTRMKDKCLMQHSCGYTWEVKPESVKRGDSWCPKCSHSTKVTESDFVKQNLHDDMKRDYTKSPGYNLLEMPYTANTQEKVDEYLADYLVSLEEKVGGIDGR